MNLFKRAFDFYIKSSIHVALVVLSFFKLSLVQFGFYSSLLDQILVFSVALVGYNTIKFAPVWFTSKTRTIRLYWISVITLIFLAIGSYSFILSPTLKQLILLCAGLLVVAYLFPINKPNFRSRTGLKITTVALAWTLVIAVFPLAEKIPFSLDEYLFVVERFLWVFIATLPFEIKDSKHDHADLGTLPHTIGIRNVKKLGYILIVIVLLTIFNTSLYTFSDCLILLFIFVCYGFAIKWITPNRSSYDTLFWIEALPLLAYLLFILKNSIL